MTSQREIWDARYRRRAAPSDRVVAEDESELARRVASLLRAPSDVLELGCGPGWDAAYFARRGHRVLATDFAGAAIHANRERFEPTEGLSFAVLDASQPFGLPASYDLVYARLSLHYFDDGTTRRIFGDIARVLRPGGLLAFMCKSTSDPLYGKGVELEPDMFESSHQRHFFSETYTRDVLAACFDIESLTSHEGLLYGEPSAWIEVVSKAR